MNNINPEQPSIAAEIDERDEREQRGVRSQRRAVRLTTVQGQSPITRAMPT